MAALPVTAGPCQRQPRGEAIAGSAKRASSVTGNPAIVGPPAFAVDLLLLERLIKAAKEFKPDGSKRGITAKFYVTDHLSAIRIEVEDGSDGTLTAVVMPMRT